ncbi:MAG: efflux RND transporter periplasmic adaptor subunit [Planctomycetaceae bacterium]
MKRWFKRLLMVVLGGGLVAGIVYAFLPQPIVVDIDTVSRGTLQIAVEEDGKTRLKDRYTISAPLAGKLQRIRFKAGDIVPKGQPVAIIEPTDPALLDPRAQAQAEARVKAAQAALEKAGSNLEWARAALDLAETEHARALDLHQKNALAKTELDVKLMQKRTRVEEYRAARFAEEMARFEVELARAALLRTRGRGSEADLDSQFPIPAPPWSNSGRLLHVLRVSQESETVVQPGTALLELGDPSDLEIEIDVLSSDAVKIRPGAKVILEQWGGDEPLLGRVRLVEPSGFTKISALGVEEQRVNVIVDFPSRDEIPATLGDGFRVEAKIVIWENDDVLRVPTSALFRQGERWALFRIVEGRAQRHRVTIGKRSGLYAEVLAELTEGEEVIVHPNDRISDGAQVKAR